MVGSPPVPRARTDAYRRHMTQNLADLPDAPRWRGVNHLALVTPDMDATVRFYAGVLGMRVVATTMAGPMRHYFFEIAPQNTVAFFEVKDSETFDKGAGSPPPLLIPIQMDHISFNLPDEAALVQLQKRLAGGPGGGDESGGPRVGAGV